MNDASPGRIKTRKAAAKPWDPALADKLRELTLLGHSRGRIAEMLGTSVASIGRARERYGLAQKKSGPPPPPPPHPLDSFPKHGECQWIHDNGPWRKQAPQWCLKRVHSGSAYCPEHHARCYMR